MFFSETIKQWQENKAIEKELALLEKKEKARSECRKDALLFFVLGTVSTILLSGLFSLMIYGDIFIYKHGGEFLSTVNTIAIICNISMYLMVIYGDYYLWYVCCTEFVSILSMFVYDGS